MDTLTTQQLCPLCQKPNACAVAESGEAASQCWCMSVKIRPDALTQLKATHQNLACICQTCAGVVKAR